jgi:hypothetical protein
MSKFIDKLKHASQAAVQPMGFGRGQMVSSEPGILLVAHLSQGSGSNLADLVSGADAGLIAVSGRGRDSKTLLGCAEAVPDIPWGGWLRGDRWQKSQKVKALGSDFVVFPAADTPLGILEDAGVGKILEIEITLSDGMLRAVDELPVDGVLLAFSYQDGSSVTWQQLMLLQRLSGLMTKPLLVTVPSKVTAGEVKVLWGAGVDGVVVEVGTAQFGGGLSGLREAVSKLDFPSRRRRGKVKTRISYINASVGTKGEEELSDDL